MTEEKSSLNFQVQLPVAKFKDEDFEQGVKKLLEESGDYYNHHGDPIMIFTMGEWEKVGFKENDDDPNSKLFYLYFRSVAAVAFSDNTNTCKLTTFRVRADKPNGSSLQEWQSLKPEAFDPRNLPKDIYDNMINKYGKDKVSAAFLKSSEVSSVDNDLIQACKKLKTLYDQDMKGNKMKNAVNDVQQLILKGANPNTIIDEDGYSVLHYARWSNIEQGIIVDFVKFLIEHGADPLLGPEISGMTSENGLEIKKYMNMTPFNFYQHADIMLENGPLWMAIGGPTDKKKPPKPSENAKTGKPVTAIDQCCSILSKNVFFFCSRFFLFVFAL